MQNLYMVTVVKMYNDLKLFDKESYLFTCGFQVLFLLLQMLPFKQDH